MTNQYEEIIKELNDILRKTLENPGFNLKPEDEIYSGIGLDSLDLVGVVMDLEKRLNIDIPDSKISGLEILGKVYAKDFINLVADISGIPRPTGASWFTEIKPGSEKVIIKTVDQDFYTAYWNPGTLEWWSESPEIYHPEEEEFTKWPQELIESWAHIPS